MLGLILNDLHLWIRSIIVDSFIFELVCCNRKHRREVLWNVYYFRTLTGSTESCLDCKQIEFLRFLNKCYLLRFKYFFKVRFACGIKMILLKCANMMRTPGKCCFNNVVFIRWKRHVLTKRDVNNSFFIALIFWKLISLVTYINCDWYVVVY